MRFMALAKRHSTLPPVVAAVWWRNCFGNFENTGNPGTGIALREEWRRRGFVQEKMNKAVQR